MLGLCASSGLTHHTYHPFNPSGIPARSGLSSSLHWSSDPHAGCWSVWVPSSLPLGSGVPDHQQTPGDSEGQRSPACCSPWVRHDWATKQERSLSRVPFHVDALRTPSALTLRWSTPVQWTPSSPPWALVSSVGCLSVWTLLALREFPPCPRPST